MLAGSASSDGERKRQIKMAESKLHYEDRYMKSYEAFIASSNKYERQDTWTKTVLLDKIVPHLPNLDQDNELRVLGAGSGSGEAVFQIIRYNNSLNNKLNLCISKPR